MREEYKNILMGLFLIGIMVLLFFLMHLINLTVSKEEPSSYEENIESSWSSEIETSGIDFSCGGEQDYNINLRYRSANHSFYIYQNETLVEGELPSRNGTTCIWIDMDVRDKGVGLT